MPFATNKSLEQRLKDPKRLPALNDIFDSYDKMEGIGIVLFFFIYSFVEDKSF